MTAADAAGARDEGPSYDGSDAEAYEVLCEMAGRRGVTLPADVLARHVMEVTQGADWPVREAAMDALLRRSSFARRDDLRVAQRPGGGERLGLYTTRAKGKATRARDQQRPYATVLYGADPPRGSCDCPDFLRSSLGLCKHLLVVLQDLYGSPRKLSDARVAQVVSAVEPALLRWHPIRPLTGAGDWLEGVCWQQAPESRRRRRVSQVQERAQRWFRADGALRSTHLGRPRRRHEMVGDLCVLLSRVARSADPALRALLEQERQRLARQLATAPLASSRKSWQRGIKRKLYPYQVEGLKRFLQTGRLLLADDMGLGKTVQAIGGCHALYVNRKVRRGIVIVPAPLKSQWLREWEQTTDVPAAIVEGGPTERAAQYEALRSGFLIMNYEQLLRDLQQVHRLDPEVVVLDEAQRIKNWATKTAAFVKSLKVPYRLVLTGTPMENRLEELASIFDWVDDLALEPKWRLGPWHTITDPDGDRGKGGARNLDTLRTRLGQAMVRRVRQDVLAQLPERTDTRVPVDMTPQQRVEHDELNQPIARLLSTARRRPLTQQEFLRLMSLMNTQRIICNGLAQLEFEKIWPTYARAARPDPMLLDGLFSPKLLELRQLVQAVAVEQGRKIVVFSQWRRMLRLAHWALSDVLGDAGLRAVFFTGAESQKLRTRSVVEFHDEPDTRLMLLSDAGGVGLNLQRAASCCINLELPWNPAVLEQRVGRIYRIGQDRPIDVYNLVSDGGIEGRIAQLVAGKQALFTGLFDGTSNEIRFDSKQSTLGQLQRLVDPVDIPALAAGSEVGADRDADASDTVGDAEVERIVTAADEMRDVAATDGLPAVGNAQGHGAATHDARAMDRGVPDSSTAGVAQEQIQQMVASLSVKRTAAGGIAIEAPPETAATLATIFGAMAKMLQAQAEG